MILKLANRNIIGNGWRSLINISILSLVLVGMIWMLSMLFSWINLSKEQLKDWEHGKGMLWHQDFDPYDGFSWDKSAAPITPAQQEAIDAGKAVPILLSSAVAYPQGRMMSCLVKGIPPEQTLLKIPGSQLMENGAQVPAMLGSALAKTMRLEKGDYLTIRIKDVNGVYDALDLQIVHIIHSPVPGINSGAIWISLADLQEIKAMPAMASQIVLSDPALASLAGGFWRYVSLDELLADINAVLETEVGQQVMMFALLIFLAMLAIFDTQILSLFKRRKEIGTLAALGMTQRRIMTLFTVEGILYMVYALVLSTIIGLPIFLWFGIRGWKLPESYQGFDMVGFTETIHFQYPPLLLITAISVCFAATALASWLPTLRIVRLKPTDALRGKTD